MWHHSLAPAADGRFELYKVSLKYDNPEARRAHDSPVNAQQMEVLDYATGKATAKSPVCSGCGVSPTPPASRLLNE